MARGWTESWHDRDHGRWDAREADNNFCDECEREIPTTIEVSSWPPDSEPGGWRPFCDTCYDALRADPFHNLPGAPHDEYVNLGAAL